MPIYTCRDFTGHYPVGAAAVVEAHDENEAAVLLNMELRKQGLKGDAESANMIAFPFPKEPVRVLVNGDY